MDGVRREQKKRDGRSGMPMGLVSVKNRHISIDSFK